MSPPFHPVASPHMPFFISAPGQTDGLTVAMAVLLIGAVLATGILFLRIHTLPERIAHKRKKIQFDIVAVLGLLALFTNVHLFWVAGLLLSLIEIPNFSNPLGRMAAALEATAGIQPPAKDPLATDHHSAKPDDEIA